MWENLRERLPEFKMMQDIQVNRDTEQRQYRSLPASPRWTQTLSNGVTVQVVGVVQTAGLFHTAWSPEGKFLSRAQYTSDAEHSSHSRTEPVQKALLALRFTYPVGQAIQTEYKLSGAVSTGYQSGFARNAGKVITDEVAINPETAGRRIVEAWFPAGQARTDLQVGVSLAPPPAGSENSTDALKEWAVFSGIVLPPAR